MLLTFKAFPQLQLQSGNTFFLAGIYISTGTHINSFGVFAKSFSLIADNFQWNNELRLNYNLRYLGPKISHGEIQFSSGLLFSYGDENKKERFFLNKNSNLTKFSNSISYCYNLYFNKIKTTQQTGSISFSFDNFCVTHENDILARPRLDRFRTAGIQVAYEHQNFRFAITQYNWTGMLGKSIKDSLYPSPAGYLDTTANRYGLLSHGILCASAEVSDISYKQQIKINLGTDAEQIRHLVQNRIIHDGCFLPKGWRNKNNYHLPMIDVKDQQYLFRDEQRIRKQKFYLNAFLNSDLIY